MLFVKFCNILPSAARKVDTKRANLLLKVAQKRATLNNWFKTSLNRVVSCYLIPDQNFFLVHTKWLGQFTLSKVEGEKFNHFLFTVSKVSGFWTSNKRGKHCLQMWVWETKEQSFSSIKRVKKFSLFLFSLWKVSGFWTANEREESSL